MTADEIKALLQLEPRPVEGGHFRRTYTSSLSVEVQRGGQSATRAMGTAIYYLLTPDTFSSMHRLRSDEIFHFYLGDPVEILVIPPGAAGRTFILSPRLTAGHRPQLPADLRSAERGGPRSHRPLRRRTP